MRNINTISACLFALAAGAGCNKDDKEAPIPSGGEVSLRRTSHGVVHVQAADTWGLGYGVGYAYAEDNACLLARRIAEVEGRLSAQLGARGIVELPVHGMSYTALSSDTFYRGWLDDATIQAGFDAGSEEIRAMAYGYAGGINQYREEHPTLSGCDVQFDGPVAVTSVYRMWVATALVASGELLAPFVASAPPAMMQRPSRDRALPTSLFKSPFGSNALAVGSGGVSGGQGSVHLYNPHFPWEGIHRVYLIHLTIPGELDVMGAALGGLPLPAAGFNQHVAWGLTFSNAARFTLAELQLEEGDPLSYRVDGEVRTISEEVYEIEVAGEGPRQVSFYQAGADPIIDAPDYRLGWGAGTAFAAHDVNRDNTRVMEQLLGLARATSVAEIESSLGSVQGMPWSYVTASDDAGQVLFAEMSNVPAVTEALLDACNHTETAELLRPLGLLVLDGASGACTWEGSMPADQLPRLTRDDYVANSNNTHDLPHPDAPLLGYSPVLGAEGDPLDLRPSLGLRQAEARLDGSDGLGAPGFTAELAQQMFRQERSLAGELLAGPIAADCLADPTGTWDGQEVDLSATCAALAAWDGRMAVDSAGAAVFDGLWRAFGEDGDPQDLFAAPADWADPLHTPSGYSADPEVREATREALARVTLALAEAGLAADSPWGEAHAILGPSGPLGAPGGESAQGVYDVLESAIGYGQWSGFTEQLSGTAPEDLFGASYVHVVSLTPDGPTASGLLAYSQATETGSPWYLDQLDLLSAGGWFSLPFTEAEIQADPALSERTW